VNGVASSAIHFVKTQARQTGAQLADEHNTLKQRRKYTFAKNISVVSSISRKASHSMTYIHSVFLINIVCMV